MEDKPNYYAILPANVRYDKNLSDKEKLLYAEITALCNKEGHCWAGNQYFADLYNVSTRTIIRAINNLVLRKYLTSKLVYEPNSKEVQKRILSVNKDYIGGDKNVMGGGDKNVTDNITSNEYILGTSKKNRGKKSSDFSPPTPEEVKKYIEEKKYNIDPMYFFEYYSSNSWKDNKNKPVKNWKLKAFMWSKNNPTVKRETQPTEELETKVEPTIFDEEYLLEAQRRQDDYIRRLKEWRLSGGRIEKPRIGF
jgi:hypothetical protein